MTENQASQKDILPFEQPLYELRERIKNLLESEDSSPALIKQAQVMQEQAIDMEKRLYETLSPWNVVQIARHPERPQTRDYIEMIIDDFEELHGDRAYRDDLAIVTGLGRLDGQRVMLIGQHRGRDVNERHASHAGCPHPEGYRKALQKMAMANRLGIPIICLIDTKGAYPGIGAEKRGQGIAVAESMREMSLFTVPVISCIIGEGGSGGALAIGVGNRVLMLQYAYYSVISPEGCAAILWRDGEKKAEAAAVLKLTSQDLRSRGFVDEVIAEPLGGAHRDRQAAAMSLKTVLSRQLRELGKMSGEALAAARYDKFRAFGEFLSEQTLPPAELDADLAAAPSPESEASAAAVEAAPSESATPAETPSEHVATAAAAPKS